MQPLPTLVYSFQVKGIHQRKREKGNINKAKTIERVKVTPNPSKRNGSNTNHMIGYNNKTIKAKGQHSTNKMAQRIIPVNILMDNIAFLKRINTNEVPKKNYGLE